MGGGRRHRSAPTCTEVGKKTRVSCFSAIPTRPPSRTSRSAAGHIRHCPQVPDSTSIAQQHRIRATAQQTGHGHMLRRPIQFLAADNNENHNGMIRRHPPKHSRIRMDRRERAEKSSTRSTTAPCACSTTHRRGIRRRTVKLTRPNRRYCTLTNSSGLPYPHDAHMQAIITLSSKFVLYAYG